VNTIANLKNDAYLNHIPASLSSVITAFNTGLCRKTRVTVLLPITLPSAKRFLKLLDFETLLVKFLTTFLTISGQGLLYCTTQKYFLHHTVIFFAHPVVLDTRLKRFNSRVALRISYLHM